VNEASTECSQVVTCYPFDAYFKRKELKKPRHIEGEIFDTKKEVYSVSEERKQDQLEVDKQLLSVVRQHSERKFMYSYLTSLFSLTARNIPTRWCSK